MYLVQEPSLLRWLHLIMGVRLYIHPTVDVHSISISTWSPCWLHSHSYLALPYRCLIKRHFPNIWWELAAQLRACRVCKTSRYVCLNEKKSRELFLNKIIQCMSFLERPFQVGWFSENSNNYIHQQLTNRHKHAVRLTFACRLTPALFPVWDYSKQSSSEDLHTGFFVCELFSGTNAQEHICWYLDMRFIKKCHPVLQNGHTTPALAHPWCLTHSQVFTCMCWHCFNALPYCECLMLSVLFSTMSVHNFCHFLTGQVLRVLCIFQ